MSRLLKEQQILQVLVENLAAPQPMVVHSNTIAEKLDISVEETCQLVKVMDEMGMVVTDADGQNSLITRKGINSVLD